MNSEGVDCGVVWDILGVWVCVGGGGGCVWVVWGGVWGVGVCVGVLRARCAYFA